MTPHAIRPDPVVIWEVVIGASLLALAADALPPARTWLFRLLGGVLSGPEHARPVRPNRRCRGAIRTPVALVAAPGALAGRA